MNLKLELEFNKTDIIKDVEALKKQVDVLRPLPADVEGKVMQKLRLDWNYHSNAIEGNRLNYGETVAFLMEGITAKGKPLKDHLDIRGHNDAINFLLDIVKDARPITEADIRSLHTMVLVEPYNSPAMTADGLPTTKRITLGEYKTSANHVKTATGEIHYYATPEETPVKMHDLMDWFEGVEKYDISPIIIAALFHHKFVAIHPFDDGNGRLSRMLMNLILMQSGYPPVVVKMDDRTNYYSLLSRADVGDSWPFVEYIAELMQASLQLYVKAANGGDIDEDDDIDKEIALFKQSLNIGKSQISSSKEIHNFFQKNIIPLIMNLIDKSRALEDLFFQSRNEIIISYLNIIYNSTETFNKTNIQIDSFFPFREEFKITTVEMKLLFFKYKYKDNDRFDVDSSLNVHFFNEEIVIMNANHTILRRPYYQGITKKDELLVIKEIISYITSSIDLFNAY